MIKKILSGVCVLALAGVSSMRAADPEGGAAPTPPFVASVPENAQWTIAISSPAQAGAPATPTPASPVGKPSAKLQELRVVKTGSIKHDTLVYSDGSADDAWYIGKSALMSDTFVKTNIYLTEFSSHDFTGAGDPIRSLGFTGMDWVQSKFFDKIATYQNVACYHYRLSGRSAAEAWVNVKDKLPVAYKINGIVYVYSFGAPPATLLVLPPAYQAVWDKSLEIKKRQKQYALSLGKH